MEQERDATRAEVVAEDTTDWEGWRITVHWHRVDGRLMPVGIDVRSFSAGPRHGPTYGEVGPREVLRDTLRHLPFGQVLRESRARVAARFMEGDPEQRAPVAYTGPSGGASDANYRLTADIYRRYAALDPREAARRTWEELERRGVTDRRGQPPSRDLVRRWLHEARVRRYIDPPGSQSGTRGEQ